MNLLKRKLSPITQEAWEEIDNEARRVLKLHLAARKVVDFDGPHGRSFAAVNTGRLAKIEPPREEITAELREVQPLVEIHAPFKLSIRELYSVTRGAKDFDLDPLVAAAERIAAAEDRSIFAGYKAAGIEGILPSAELPPISFQGIRAFPKAIVEAKERLRKAGVGGPYALVLGPALYDELHAASEDGYPIYNRINSMVEQHVWAPALSEAVLLSTRGGDFELTVGMDFSIGYTAHDRDTVELYLTESFTFRVLTKTAAVGINRQP